MKAITLHILMIFTVQNIYSQTDSFEKLQYVKLSKDFLNSINLQDSLYISKNPYRFSKDCIVNLKNDNFFTSEEIQYIKRKNNRPDIKEWSKEILNEKSKITKNELRKYWTYCQYSSPIFLRNFTYCIFYFEEHCGDGICGDYGLTLYKKSNNQWVAIKTYCGAKWINGKVEFLH